MICGDVEGEGSARLLDAAVGLEAEKWVTAAWAAAN